MASWDDEDFDDAPPSVPNGLKTDRWEGEDEEVADAWDDEDEEKTETGDSAATDAQKKRRRNLKEIIQEKEQKRIEELARKKALAATEESTEMTPEAIRRAQEESDLLLAKEAFGCSDSTPSVDTERSIDHQNPKSKDDFEKLQFLIRDKLLLFEKSPHFPVFLENVFRDVSINQDADTLRKLSTMFAAMANEKVKQQKSKAKKKGAAKGKIATIRDNDFVNDANPEYDEFDDFM